jgi:hypothetical protein
MIVMIVSSRVFIQTRENRSLACKNCKKTIVEENLCKLHLNRY